MLVVDEADEMISIGEAAKIIGVSIDTLRRWDDAKRGPRPIRSASGQRRYRKADVIREARGDARDEP